MGGLLPLLDLTWAHNLPSAFSAAFLSCNWSSTAPGLLPHSKSTLRGVTRCCTQTRLPPACPSWTSSQSEEEECDSLDFTKNSLLSLPQGPSTRGVKRTLWCPLCNYDYMILCINTCEQMSHLTAHVQDNQRAGVVTHHKVLWVLREGNDVVDGDFWCPGHRFVSVDAFPGLCVPDLKHSKIHILSFVLALRQWQWQ